MKTQRKSVKLPGAGLLPKYSNPLQLKLHFVFAKPGRGVMDYIALRRVEALTEGPFTEDQMENPFEKLDQAFGSIDDGNRGHGARGSKWFLVDVEAVGPKLQGFEVDAAYSDFPEGGCWGDTIKAATAEDAELIARLRMALNCGGGVVLVNGERVSGYDADDLIEYASGLMSHHITRVMPVAETASHKQLKLIDALLKRVSTGKALPGDDRLARAAKRLMKDAGYVGNVAKRKVVTP